MGDRIPDRPILFHGSAYTTWRGYRYLEDRFGRILRETSWNVENRLIAFHMLLLGLARTLPPNAKGMIPDGYFEKQAGGTDARLLEIAVASTSHASARRREEFLTAILTLRDRLRGAGISESSRLYDLLAGRLTGKPRFRTALLPGPVSLAAVRNIAFPLADPDFSSPIERYLEQVVFRGFPMPILGVARGCDLLLGSYGLLKWFAKAKALLAGRAQAGIADVAEAISIVDENFVLDPDFQGVLSRPARIGRLLDRAFEDLTFAPAIVKGD